MVCDVPNASPALWTQAIKSGRRLLFEVFQNAEPHSLVLTLMSSLKDAALFLRDNKDLFFDKIRYVTIMGAVKPVAGGNSHLVADCATAQNMSYVGAPGHHRCADPYHAGWPLPLALAIYAKHA